MGDIGKNAVFVLLILTIIASVFGTLALVGNLDNVQSVPEQPTEGGSTLQLTVTDPPSAASEGSTLSLTVA